MLSRWLSGKESAFNAGATGDVGSIVGSERSPGGGHSNPLQYSYLENPMDRGPTLIPTVHRVMESNTTEATQHLVHTHTHTFLLDSTLLMKGFTNDLPERCEQEFLVSFNRIR